MLNIPAEDLLTRTGRIFVTETTESFDTSGPAKSGRTRKGEGLSSMVLPDLKALAGQLGIRGTSGMRKGGGDRGQAGRRRNNSEQGAAPQQSQRRERHY